MNDAVTTLFPGEDDDNQYDLNNSLEDVTKKEYSSPEQFSREVDDLEGQLKGDAKSYITPQQTYHNLEKKMARELQIAPKGLEKTLIDFTYKLTGGKVNGIERKLKNKISANQDTIDQLGAKLQVYENKLNGVYSKKWSL